MLVVPFETFIDLQTILIIGQEKIISYFRSFFKKHLININLVFFYNFKNFINRQQDSIGRINLIVIDIYAEDWLNHMIKLQQKHNFQIENILLVRSGCDHQYRALIQSFSTCFSQEKLFLSLINECANLDDYNQNSLKQFIDLKIKKDYYRFLSEKYFAYVDQNTALQNKISSFVDKEKEYNSKKEDDKKFLEENIKMLHSDLCSNVEQISLIKNQIENNSSVHEIVRGLDDLKNNICNLSNRIDIIHETYAANSDNLVLLEECFKKVSTTLQQKLNLGALTINFDSLKDYQIKLSPVILNEIIFHYLYNYLKAIKNNPPQNIYRDLITIEPKQIGKILFLKMNFLTDQKIDFLSNQFIDNIIQQLNINVINEFSNKNQMINLIFPSEISQK